jgi:hypothetical protein
MPQVNLEGEPVDEQPAEEINTDTKVSHTFVLGTKKWSLKVSEHKVEQLLSGEAEALHVVYKGLRVVPQKDFDGGECFDIHPGDWDKAVADFVSRLDRPGCQALLDSIKEEEDEVQVEAAVEEVD